MNIRNLATLHRLAILVSVTLTCATLRAAEPRLAIIGADERCSTAADLLTVQLASSPDLVVLERSETERMRKEQNLTAGKSADFARLGQRLGAHGVLVLEVIAHGRTTNLSARLIAVQQGAIVHFQSYAFPLQQPAEWAAVASKAVLPSVAKLTLLPRESVAISLLNLRAALRTAEAVQLEKDATRVLAHRLAARREIFVLERQRLPLLLAEKELKDIQESAFWNGSYLFEGIVEGGGSTRQPLVINARLVSPSRESATLVVRSDTGDLIAAVEQLALSVAARLNKGTNAPAWESAAEAKRYLEEARWGMRWQAYALAQSAADSAWALGDHSVEAAQMRVTSYARSAGAVSRSAGYSQDEFVAPTDPVNPQAIPALIIALENFEALTPALGANATQREWTSAGEEALRLAAGHLSHFWYYPDEAAKLANELGHLRQLARNAETLLLGGVERPDAATYRSGAGARLWSIRMDYGWVYAESPEAAVTEFERLFDSGMNVTQRHQFLASKHRWMMPWDAADRARASKVWNTFIEKAAASTNAVTAVAARLLDLRYPLPKERAAAESELTRRQQLAATTFLAHRHELMCNEPQLTRLTLQYLDRVVVQRFAHMTPAAMVRTNCVAAIVEGETCWDDNLLQDLLKFRGFETNHFAQVLAGVSRGNGTNTPAMMRKRFFTAYFKTGDNPLRHEVFEHLFRAEEFSREEARRIFNNMSLPKRSTIENLDTVKLKRSENDPLVKDLASFKAFIGDNVEPAKQTDEAPPRRPNGAELPLAWWQPEISQSETQKVIELYVYNVLPREEYAWAHVLYRLEWKIPTEDPNWFHLKRQFFHRFYRIDLRTGVSVASPEIIPPDTFSGPPAYFTDTDPYDVLGGTLYLYQDYKLTSWRPGDAAWKPVALELPAVVPSQARLNAIGQRLYFSSPDTLLEIEPSTPSAKIMASKRRNPPLADEDRLATYGTPSFLQTADNVVSVLIDSTFHQWDFVASKWNAAIAMQRMEPSPGTNSDAILRWVSDRYTGERQLMRVTRSRGAETLFHTLPPGDRIPPFVRSQRKPAAVTSVWPLPETASTEYAFSANDWTNIWTLNWQDRKLAFFDDRFNEPALVSLLPYPAAPRVLGHATVEHNAPGRMLLKPANGGLVFLCKLAAGFWYAPEPDIDRAFAKVTTPHTPRLGKTTAASVKSSATQPTDAIWADERSRGATEIMQQFGSTPGKGLNMADMARAIQKRPELTIYRAVLTNGIQSSWLLIQPYDTNRNGRVDVPELDAMLKADKPKRTWEDFLKLNDRNGDGKVDMEEVIATSRAESDARRAAFEAGREQRRPSGRTGPQ